MKRFLATLACLVATGVALGTTSLLENEPAPASIDLENEPITGALDLENEPIMRP